MSSETALVVIDTQVNNYEDKALEQINILLAKARSAGTPVIYVQHDGPKGHPLEVGTEGWQIHPAIAPQANEPIVRKESPDSFLETTLQQELEARGIKQLVICGGATDCCVDTTVRSAVAKDYNVILASDAHFSEDMGNWTNDQVVALFNLVLNGFWAGEHVVRVKPTEEIDFSRL